MVLLVIIKSNHIISCKNVASSRSCSATRNFCLNVHNYKSILFFLCLVSLCFVLNLVWLKCKYIYSSLYATNFASCVQLHGIL